MLNITAQKNAAGAKSYFAVSDYYSEGQEIVGDWGGKGAVLLGLFGQVDKAQFDQLCDNINPATGKQLTALTRDGRRVGYDFTWSAPKSVSVVHALSGDEWITTAFRDSISDTMKEMEAETRSKQPRRSAGLLRSLPPKLAHARFGRFDPGHGKRQDGRRQAPAE